MQYKVTRTIDGIVSALSHKSGEYYWVSVNSEKALKLPWNEVSDWKKHLEEIRRYADGSIRPRCSGLIQIVAVEQDYQSFGRKAFYHASEGI